MSQKARPHDSFIEVRHGCVFEDLADYATEAAQSKPVDVQVDDLDEVASGSRKNAQSAPLERRHFTRGCFYFA